MTMCVKDLGFIIFSSFLRERLNPFYFAQTG